MVPDYLFAYYYVVKPFLTTFVGNVSKIDARRNDNGAIQLWSPQTDFLKDLIIKGNKIDISPSTYGRPRALFIDGRTVNLLFSNNVINSTLNNLFIETTPLQTEMRFDDNTFNTVPCSVLWEGNFFESSSKWLKFMSRNTRSPLNGNNRH
jgi:hypothetical protein